MEENLTNSVSHWCSKCSELSPEEFCTCTKDPFDAVDVFKEVPYLRVTLATYFICIVFGALGNLITLVTMATADRKNKTGTNIFLISLSVSSRSLLLLTPLCSMVHRPASWERHEKESFLNTEKNITDMLKIKGSLSVFTAKKPLLNGLFRGLWVERNKGQTYAKRLAIFSGSFFKPSFFHSTNTKIAVF